MTHMELIRIASKIKGTSVNAIGNRDLLEMAASAANIDFTGYTTRHKNDAQGEPRGWWGLVLEDGSLWNPLMDDGDALRLLNTLNLSIIHTTCLDNAPVVMVGDYPMERESLEQHPTFLIKNEVVRLCIVSAAIQYGARLKGIFIEDLQ